MLKEQLVTVGNSSDSAETKEQVSNAAAETKTDDDVVESLCVADIIRNLNKLFTLLLDKQRTGLFWVCIKCVMRTNENV